MTISVDVGGATSNGNVLVLESVKILKLMSEAVSFIIVFFMFISPFAHVSWISRRRAHHSSVLFPLQHLIQSVPPRIRPNPTYTPASPRLAPLGPSSST
jgi:hypothetical protein